MKSIICKLNKYDVIGFDLDGTLYDEFDFVKQAYQGVADVMRDYVHASSSEIRRQLNIEWLKIGSSGPVFQNVFRYFGIQEPDKAIIKACVMAYRDTPFTLTLCERAKVVLDFLKGEGKILYLITDGNGKLQRKKIESLGLQNWFPFISISGDYGREYQKPSRYMFDRLKEKVPKIDQSIYCGDREVDSKFAESASIDFLCIRSMCLAQE